MTPKNKKVSNKFRANLYAFTCIACVLWFAQSYTDFSKAGTLTSAPSIFLLVCIGIVVVYTGVEAIVYWIRPSDKEKAEEQSRDDQDVSAADTAGTAGRTAAAAASIAADGQAHTTVVKTPKTDTGTRGTGAADTDTMTNNTDTLTNKEPLA
jgi:hypothetical protein